MRVHHCDECDDFLLFWFHIFTFTYEYNILYNFLSPIILSFIPLNTKKLLNQCLYAYTYIIYLSGDPEIGETSKRIL